MNSYCVKCKNRTMTNDVKIRKTKNNKYVATGSCNICNNKKSTFISKEQGEGLLGRLLFPSKGKIPVLGDIPLIGALF